MAAVPAAWKLECGVLSLSDDDATIYPAMASEFDVAQVFEEEGEYPSDEGPVYGEASPGQLARLFESVRDWATAARLRRYGRAAFQVRCAVRRLVPRTNGFVCIRPARRPTRSALGRGDEPDAATCGAQPCLRPVVLATRRRPATWVKVVRSVVGKEVRHVYA